VRHLMGVFSNDRWSFLQWQRIFDACLETLDAACVGPKRLRMPLQVLINVVYITFALAEWGCKEATPPWMCRDENDRRFPYVSSSYTLYLEYVTGASSTRKGRMKPSIFEPVRENTSSSDISGFRRPLRSTCSRRLSSLAWRRVRWFWLRQVTSSRQKRRNR
jgi:hypothetical protein